MTWLRRLIEVRRWLAERREERRRRAAARRDRARRMRLVAIHVANAETKTALH